MRASTKMHGTTFIDFIFAIKWLHCENYTSWPWPTFWRSSIWNINISEIMRAWKKILITFIDFYICRRTVSLQKNCILWPWPTFWRLKTSLTSPKQWEAGHKKREMTLNTRYFNKFLCKIANDHLAVRADLPPLVQHPPSSCSFVIYGYYSTSAFTVLQTFTYLVPNIW